MKKNIAIIGAASFIGSRILKSNSAHNFIPIVRKPSGLPNEKIVPNYTEIPKEALTDIDTVINCVGMVKGRDKTEYYQVNEKLVFNIAQSIKQAGVKHFIHFSSLSVYGNLELATETSATSPVSLYGKSKLAGDRALRALECDGFAITYIRPPIVYDETHGGKIAVLANFMAKFRFFVCPITPPERSIISMSVLNHYLNAIINSQTNGPVLIADHETMTIPMIRGIVEEETQRSVFLIKLPLIVFLPIKIVAPSLYDSLFRSQTVEVNIQADKAGYPKDAGKEGLKTMIEKLF